MDTIEKVGLEAENVRLEPLASTHLPGLAEAITDGRLWEVPFTFVPHPSELPGFLADAERGFAQRTELAFATIDKASGKVAGSTRFMFIDQVHKKAEIGFTFLAASRQRSALNSEAKYLMLRHAFEVWQLNRVQLITDVLNEKSRSAIVRIGAKQEGILRSHLIMRDGRVRDSVSFSIIASEWPEAKRALEAKLRGSKAHA
jgi:RimJ/RimL family protein N-acetyltransferase